MVFDYVQVNGGIRVCAFALTTETMIKMRVQEGEWQSEAREWKIKL